MRSALETLDLERLDLIHAGDESLPLAERVREVPLRRVWEELEALRWVRA